MSKLVSSIETLLASKRNETIAKGQTRYFKNNDKLKFYGIKAGPLKKLFTEHYKENLSELELSTKVDLASNLISSEYSEQKIFGIQILSKNVRNFNSDNMETFGKLFDNVYDWATCDTLSGKVFHEMIKNNHKKIKRKMKL